MVGANENQRWKRQSVDEVENWFMWSNTAHDKKSTNEFLAAPENSALNMKGRSFVLFSLWTYLANMLSSHDSMYHNQKDPLSNYETNVEFL